MAIIQAPTGLELAGIYEVVSGRIGLGPLLSEEGVHLSHEMGATIFSERLTGAIRRVTTGAIAQSLDFDVVTANMPDQPTRIIGVEVVTTLASRLVEATVYAILENGNREIPIWCWDQTNDLPVRMVENGAPVADLQLLLRSPGIGVNPSMLTGIDQTAPVSQISFRGTTTAFGAGTVTATALIHIMHANLGGISSKGLPLPGW